MFYVLDMSFTMTDIQRLNKYCTGWACWNARMIAGTISIIFPQYKLDLTFGQIKISPSTKTFPENISHFSSR